MSAERKQSRWAALLLAGLILAGLGGFGTWYFGLKLVEEKEAKIAPGDHLSTVTPSPALAQNNEAIKVEPDKKPVIQLEKTPAVPATEPKSTPAPVAAQAAPSSTPAAPVSKPDTAWNLNDNQRKQIVNSLHKFAGKNITISSVESDKEGFAFAGMLKGIFEEAGWQVDGVKQVSYGKPPSGLNLVTGSFPYPSSLVTTYEAFTSAGFKVSQQLDARLTGGQAELIVGTRQ